MGKRYYCDYCDRSFPDSADNRKKHITGVIHQRQRKLHYDTFRDARAILDEELAKKPCKRFRQQGECEFGTACRFSHLSVEDICRLESQASLDRYEKQQREAFVPTLDQSALNSFISKVSKRENPEANPSPELSLIESSLKVHSWALPVELQNRPDLPPSLNPPSLDDIIRYGVSSTWG